MPEPKSHIAPVWRNKPAPCGGSGGCPAQTNIAAALHALSINDTGQAWKIMMDSHPLRAVLGRVCYKFCELPCNRRYFDSAISIQALEAVIGDHGFDPDWRPDIAPANGKRVLIIGSGPAGLTAGWFLNLSGFDVEIREAEDKPGGMLLYGIPPYRLDKKTLDREIGFIETCGVKIRLNSETRAEDIPGLMSDGSFDAAIIASGAGKSRQAGFPGEDKAIRGLDFLRDINNGTHDRSLFEGKKVVVIGGGNVAMDACRSAIRLGPSSVTVVYRRTEEMAPAHVNEMEQAKNEGVAFRFMGSPEEYDGRIVKIRVMKLGQPDQSGTDQSGRMRPEPTDETFEMEADVLITAIGQAPVRWEIDKNENIFMAGDINPESEGTVIHAIASGKEAASSVSESLAGGPMFKEPEEEEVAYDKMNIDRYFTPQMRMRSPAINVADRLGSFDVVEPVPSLDEGVVEAGRCFRCGLCVGGLNSDCDWCFRACGDGAVKKMMVEWNPKGPLFESDNCNSCGKCWEDCPRYVVLPAPVED